MSLRYQINLRILFSSLCILILGGSIALWQARTAVDKEVESSINLAVKLIAFGFSKVEQNTQPEKDWLSQFNTLKETRHLNIQLKQPSGNILNLTHSNVSEQLDNIPPQWFINLLDDGQYQVEHQISAINGITHTLIIQANPLDEITEVWEESLGFFGSFFFLTLFTFLTVNLVFNKAIKATNDIVDALQAIENGNYQHMAAGGSITEYDIIAKAVNHLAHELDLIQEENRALTQHSLEIQEDERQHLSQELHDELGQSITAIKVMAVTASHQKADINLTTEGIVDICDHVMKVVRSMMHQLHPLVLTELGLKATMEDLLNHWTARNPELSLTIDCPDEVDHLEHKITIQVFRIVQECLTNIVRHAQAKHALIKLTIKHDANLQKTLFLEVNDDGKGCAHGKIKSGFGLLGMRERVKSLGGQFTIQTSPEQGMKILASIPL
ncbi:MAG: ATP-binding protein [Methylococcales bacterium]|nr:histidine kinase [Methylococcaceae bacterium]